MKSILLFLPLLIHLTSVVGHSNDLLVDSVIHYEYSSPDDSLLFLKTLFTRDSREDAIAYEMLAWDENENEWTALHYQEYSYFPDGNYRELYFFKLDTVSNDWAVSSKYEFDYDTLGNQTYSLLLQYLSGTWKNYLKTEAEYDLNSKQTLFVKYQWSTGLDDWVAVDRHEQAFADDGSPLLGAYYQWSTDLAQLIGQSKYVHIVNEDGVLMHDYDYVWDTLANDWGYERKVDYTYDMDGHQTSRTDYKWDAALKAWIGTYKYEAAYGTGGNKELSTTYRWDPVISDWMNWYRTEYSYNSNNQVLLEVSYNWNIGLNIWDPTFKVENLYGADRKLESRTEHTWDGNQWHFNKKNEYEWDVYVDWIEMREYTYEADAWELSRLEERFYDSAGTVIGSSGRDRDYQQGIWTGGYRNEYRKDTNGNDLLYESYKWDRESQSWFGEKKRIQGYDPDGNMALYVRYVWDTLAGDWIGKTRQQNEFDRQGNQTSYIYENWDKDLPGFVSYQKGFYHKGIYLFREYDSICSGENLQWQGDLRDTEGTYQEAYLSYSGRDSIYELNLTVNPAPEPIHITGQDLVHAYSIYTYSVPQNPDLSYNWWAEGGNQISTPTKNTAEIQWGKEGEGALFVRAENNYGCLSDTAGLMVSIGTLHSGEIAGKGITVYPNPVIDILIISSQNPIERIEILDLNGHRVLSSGNQEIDCSKLAPGTYIVRIMDHGGAVIGYTRIIKNH